MTLNELKRNQTAKVVYLPEDEVLRERLVRLNLTIGRSVQVVASSRKGATVVVSAGDTVVAVGRSVARQIGVAK